MKLATSRNVVKWIDDLKAQKDLHNSKLHWTLSYFSFCNYWIYLISDFVSLLGIPIGIMNTVTGIKIGAIVQELKTFSQKS